MLIKLPFSSFTQHISGQGERKDRELIAGKRGKGAEAEGAGPGLGGSTGLAAGKARKARLCARGAVFLTTQSGACISWEMCRTRTS